MPGEYGPGPGEDEAGNHNSRESEEALLRVAMDAEKRLAEQKPSAEALWQDLSPGQRGHIADGVQEARQKIAAAIEANDKKIAALGGTEAVAVESPVAVENPAVAERTEGVNAGYDTSKLGEGYSDEAKTQAAEMLKAARVGIREAIHKNSEKLAAMKQGDKPPEREPQELGRDAQMFKDFLKTKKDDEFLEKEAESTGVYNRHPSAIKEMMEQLQSNGVIHDGPDVTITRTHEMEPLGTGWKRPFKNFIARQKSKDLNPSAGRLDLYSVESRKDVALSVLYNRNKNAKLELAGWAFIKTKDKQAAFTKHKDAYDATEALKEAMADMRVEEAATTSHIMPGKEVDIPGIPPAPHQEDADISAAVRQSMIDRDAEMMIQPVRKTVLAEELKDSSKLNENLETDEPFDLGNVYDDPHGHHDDHGSHGHGDQGGNHEGHGQADSHKEGSQEKEAKPPAEAEPPKQEQPVENPMQANESSEAEDAQQPKEANDKGPAKQVEESVEQEVDSAEQNKAQDDDESSNFKPGQSVYVENAGIGLESGWTVQDTETFNAAGERLYTVSKTLGKGTSISHKFTSERLLAMQEAAAAAKSSSQSKEADTSAKPVVDSKSTASTSGADKATATEDAQNMGVDREDDADNIIFEVNKSGEVDKVSQPKESKSEGRIEYSISGSTDEGVSKFTELMERAQAQDPKFNELNKDSVLKMAQLSEKQVMALAPQANSMEEVRAIEDELWLRDLKEHEANKDKKRKFKREQGDLKTLGDHIGGRKLLEPLKKRRIQLATEQRIEGWEKYYDRKHAKGGGETQEPESKSAESISLDELRDKSYETKDPVELQRLLDEIGEREDAALARDGKLAVDAYAESKRLAWRETEEQKLKRLETEEDTAASDDIEQVLADNKGDESEVKPVAESAPAKETREEKLARLKSAYEKQNIEAPVIERRDEDEIARQLQESVIAERATSRRVSSAEQQAVGEGNGMIEIEEGSLDRDKEFSAEEEAESVLREVARLEKQELVDWQEADELFKRANRDGYVIMNAENTAEVTDKPGADRIFEGLNDIFMRQEEQQTAAENLAYELEKALAFDDVSEKERAINEIVEEAVRTGIASRGQNGIFGMVKPDVSSAASFTFFEQIETQVKRRLEPPADEEQAEPNEVEQEEPSEADGGEESEALKEARLKIQEQLARPAEPRTGKKRPKR